MPLGALLIIYCSHIERLKPPIRGLRDSKQVQKATVIIGRGTQVNPSVLQQRRGDDHFGPMIYQWIARNLTS